MHRNSPIARRGHQLMSLASLAAFAVSVTWLFGLVRLLMATHGQPIHGSIELFGAHVDDAENAMRGSQPWRVVAVLLPILVAAVWPWLGLRRLGAALYRCPAVSSTVARRLQQLGHALAGSAILTLLVIPALSSALSQGRILTAGLSSTFYIQAVAATCAFTMALIMREAVRLAEENKSFV